MTCRRYLAPVPRGAVTARQAAVFEQMTGDIGRELYPGIAHAADVYAAGWALLRESLLAGRGSRTDAEAVATAVATANRIPFPLVPRGNPGDPRLTRLVDWAGSTATPTPLPAPFRPHRDPELLGTALAVHFFNRMAVALVGDRPQSPGSRLSWTVRRLAGRAAARLTRRPVAGAADPAVLTGIPTEPPPAWAADSPVGAAYAALRHTADTGAAMLSPRARAVIGDAVLEFGPIHPPLVGDWPELTVLDLFGIDRIGGRLALLAAIAPHRITAGHIAAWHAVRPDPADLVRLIAFGAMTAVTHIEQSVSAFDLVE